VAHPLNDSEGIMPYVRILRGIGNKPFIRQPRSKVMVKVGVNVWIRNIRRPTFQTMLADNNWTSLTGAYIFGNQEDPVGKYFRPHIKHYLISPKLWLI
jgi:hypothetical protein